MPASASFASAAATCVIELVRMVGVHDDDRRQPRAAQQVDQLIGHALGNHDRQPRVNSQSAQVRNRRQLLDQSRPACDRRS